MHGKHHSDKAKVVDYERQSCGIGGVIPDPQLLNTTSEKFARYRQHLTTVEKKQFTYTGDSWNIY